MSKEFEYVVDDNPSVRFSIPEHEHRWVVYSTALSPPVIMVHCNLCKAMGYISKYTTQQWNQAFYSPSAPYGWLNNSLVKVWTDNNGVKI